MGRKITEDLLVNEEPDSQIYYKNILVAIEIFKLKKHTSSCFLISDQFFSTVEQIVIEIYTILLCKCH